MSILINDMDMPKTDSTFPTWITLRITSDGDVWVVHDEKIIEISMKYTRSKAIELPPHGDLIERKKLIEDSLKAEAFLPNNEIVEWFQQKISSAPTVLEANNESRDSEHGTS